MCACLCVGGGGAHVRVANRARGGTQQMTVEDVERVMTDSAEAVAYQEVCVCVSVCVCSCVSM